MATSKEPGSCDARPSRRRGSGAVKFCKLRAPAPTARGRLQRASATSSVCEGRTQPLRVSRVSEPLCSSEVVALRRLACICCVHRLDGIGSGARVIIVEPSESRVWASWTPSGDYWTADRPFGADRSRTGSRPRRSRGHHRRNLGSLLRLRPRSPNPSTRASASLWRVDIESRVDLQTQSRREFSCPGPRGKGCTGRGSPRRSADRRPAGELRAGRCMRSIC